MVRAEAQQGLFEQPQTAGFVPSLVTDRIDESRLVRLTGNTSPAAKQAQDLGLADAGRLLARMVLVLGRSPEQEKALAEFNERQYDPTSPDFHRWLSAEEFGRSYGPSDADMAAITAWLTGHGFTIDEVTRGRVSIQFSGTIRQVQDAFHVQMHRYSFEGKEHLSNDQDPTIPQALSTIVQGIASLNDFFPKHYSHPGNFVKRDLHTGRYSLLDPVPSPRRPVAEEEQAGGLETNGFRSLSAVVGVQPEFGFVDPNTGFQREELSPYDVATIYNILPL